MPSNYEKRQLQKRWSHEHIDFKVINSDVNSMGKPFVEVLPYIPGIRVMAFLDEQFGYDRWKNAYVGDGKLAGLSIEISGKFVTKFNTVDLIGDELPGAIEWGIGRYLRGIEPISAECSFEKKEGFDKTCSTHSRQKIYWKYPDLPKRYQEYDLVSKKDLEIIVDLVDKIDKDPKTYLEHLGVKNFSKLYVHEANEIIRALNGILKATE